MLAAGNLGYSGIWYDEAMQIWVSQGLAAWEPSDALTGGWRGVVRANRMGNLDPGGYSFLLHVWTRFDTGLAWLRLSPFLFFLLSAGLLAGQARELTESWWAALLAPFLLFAYGEILAFAFEVRAYSMELCGVLAVGYALHRTVARPRLSSHVALGIICAVFMWSRYSFVVVVGATLAALACARVGRLGRPADELLRLAGLTVPIVDSGILIYRVTLRHHLIGLRGGGSEPLAGLQAPDYVARWVLARQPVGVILAALRTNLFSPPAWPLTLALVGLACWPWLRGRLPPALWPGARSFPAVASLALFAQAGSLALSLAGYYPWDLSAKWSLYLHGVSLLCALYLGSACWCVIRSDRRAPALAAVALALASVLTFRASTFLRTHWADLGPALTRLERLPEPRGRVFVTHYEVPALRYFYELGPLRESPRYPGGFRFERPAEAAAQTPIETRSECLEYVVSAASRAVLAPRITGGQLGPAPAPAPPHLHRIELAGPNTDPCQPASPAASRPGP
jgi:hypothetical protein